MAYDVIAIGELLADLAETGKNESGYPVFSANPGGAPANFLAALAACGKGRMRRVRRPADRDARGGGHRHGGDRSRPGSVYDAGVRDAGRGGRSELLVRKEARCRYDAP